MLAGVAVEDKGEKEEEEKEEEEEKKEVEEVGLLELPDFERLIEDL